jgi:hypothetical protein
MKYKTTYNFNGFGHASNKVGVHAPGSNLLETLYSQLSLREGSNLSIQKCDVKAAFEAIDNAICDLYFVASRGGISSNSQADGEYEFESFLDAGLTTAGEGRFVYQHVGTLYPNEGKGFSCTFSKELKAACRKFATEDSTNIYLELIIFWTIATAGATGMNLQSILDFSYTAQKGQSDL